MTSHEGTILYRVGSDIYTVIKNEETHDNVLCKVVKLDQGEHEELLKLLANKQEK